jgi:hypothetical protein
VDSVILLLLSVGGFFSESKPGSRIQFQALLPENTIIALFSNSSLNVTTERALEGST